MKRLQTREVSSSSLKGRRQETGGGGLKRGCQIENVCPVVSEVVDLVPQD